MTFPLRVRAHQLQPERVYDALFDNDTLLWCLASGQDYTTPPLTADTDHWYLKRGRSAAEIHTQVQGSSELIWVDSTGTDFLSRATAVNDTHGYPHFQSVTDVPQASWTAGAGGAALRHFVLDSPPVVDRLAITTILSGATLRIVWTVQVETLPASIVFGTNLVGSKLTKALPGGGDARHPSQWPAAKTWHFIAP